MNNRELKKKIETARPHISLISPITGWIVLGFGWLNVLLGIGLYNSPQSSTQRLVVVNHILTLKVYAALFMVLGLVMLYGYVRNNWSLMKKSLVAGLFIKATWLIALTILAFDNGSLILLVIWSFLTYVQAITYIYFVPGLRRADDH